MLNNHPTLHLAHMLVPATLAPILELSTESRIKQNGLQGSGTLESHGDLSLGLLSIKDNRFYVHRKVTLTLRLAQSKQTDIVKMKILPPPRLMTRNSCNESLALLLNKQAGPGGQKENPLYHEAREILQHPDSCQQQHSTKVG